MALTDEDLQKIGDLMDEKMDFRFAEYDKKLDRRFEEHTKQLISLMLEHFPTKEEMNTKIDEAVTSAKDELGERITAVQDSVVQFHQHWQYGEPVMVGKKVGEHDKAIDSLDKRVSKLEVAR